MTILLQIPKSRQGEFEQRQVARFSADVIQNAFDQTTLKSDALDFGGFLDDSGELLPGHGTQLDICVLNGISEGTVSQGLTEKVGSQGDQERGSGFG